MKKFVTTLCAFAVALTLSVPVFAKKHEKKEKTDTSSMAQTQAHAKHAKKKGSTEGKKAGQQGTTPTSQK